MAKEDWQIRKYTLETLFCGQTLELPAGARVLKFDTQYNQPRIWALVDAAKTTNEVRLFVLVATGADASHVAADGAYIGTALLDNGLLVMHLFEVATKESVNA
jgi:hypothetical protein